MTIKPRDEVTVADIEVILPFIAQVNAGGDLHRLGAAVSQELVKIGTPPALKRAVSQFITIAAIDKRIEKCTDEKLLALLRAQRALLEADAPPEQIFPLADLCRSLSGNGKKRRKLGTRCTLAIFSAAVTVLKKGRRVDDVIAEVATPSGINRKELKNFRDRLNRGLAHSSDESAYRTALAYMESMTRAEIMSHLAGVSVRFCT